MEEVMKMLQAIQSKMDKQDEVIQSLVEAKKEAQEVQQEVKAPDVVDKQKLLEEARSDENNLLNVTKGIFALEQFLEENNPDYQEIKSVVNKQPTNLGKLKELEKAVFFTTNEINDSNQKLYGSLKGSFSEEGTGVNLKINEILAKNKEEKMNNDAPSYFASGGKTVTKENLLDKISSFYKKTTQSLENKPLPRVISNEDLNLA